MAPALAPTGWDDAQAHFYADTLEASDYVERVAPLLGGPHDDLLDVGAGCGALGARVLADGALWRAVEPQPAMQRRLRRREPALRSRAIRLALHDRPWQQLDDGLRGQTLLAANLGAAHCAADTFLAAVADRWTCTMHWVVAAQAGPSTFCLAGFLPAELHGADTRPAVERTLEQLGTAGAPHRIRYVDWRCRFVFPDLGAAQAHFLDRLGLMADSDPGRAVCRHVERHANPDARGLVVGCDKRSAVLTWSRR